MTNKAERIAQKVDEDFINDVEIVVKFIEEVSEAKIELNRTVSGSFYFFVPDDFLSKAEVTKINNYFRHYRIYIYDGHLMVKISA